MQLGYKKKLAKDLAKVKGENEEIKESSEYFQRVFKLDNRED